MVGAHWTLEDYERPDRFGPYSFEAGHTTDVWMDEPAGTVAPPAHLDPACAGHDRHTRRHHSAIIKGTLCALCAQPLIALRLVRHATNESDIAQLWLRGHVENHDGPTRSDRWYQHLANTHLGGVRRPESGTVALYVRGGLLTNIHGGAAEQLARLAWLRLKQRPTGGAIFQYQQRPGQSASTIAGIVTPTFLHSLNVSTQARRHWDCAYHVEVDTKHHQALLSTIIGLFEAHDGPLDGAETTDLLAVAHQLTVETRP